MSKIKSLISILTLVGLIMTSCGKETIYIEKEPDGSGYENLDPAVRALIDDLGNRTWPSYVETVSYNPNIRIIPAGGIMTKIIISGTKGPWSIRAVEIYPTEGGSEIELIDAVISDVSTEITFPANPKNDVIVWELQIKPHDGTEWSYFGFYVQLCNNEMAYEIQDVEYNLVNADTESINIRLTKQNVMESEDDILWFTVYEEGSSESIDSQPYNLTMMSAGAYTELKINANEDSNGIRILQIYYHLNASSEKYYLGAVIQRPSTYIPPTVVSGLKIGDGGHHQIEAIGGTRTLQLNVGYCPVDEIKVRVQPYAHSAYKSDFSPLEFTARRSEGWKFDVEFPVARGAGYQLGDEAGAWHVDFDKMLQIGINGAGCWSVSYENEQGAWIPFGQVVQRAYHLSVRNNISMLRKGGGEWVLQTHGIWPQNSVRFRAVGLDKGTLIYTGEVYVNSMYTGTSYWEDAPALTIPENTSGSPIEWNLQFWVDEIGDWKTWEDFFVPGTLTYGWEGEGNQLIQYHF